MLSCNEMSAEYLFMTDKLYDIKYDTGDKVIQCGRHNDIFKLWLQWRSKGDSGFEALMDRLMDLTHYEVKRIKEQSDKFYLIMEPECVNVSFWYIPILAPFVGCVALHEGVWGCTRRKRSRIQVP